MPTLHQKNSSNPTCHLANTALVMGDIWNILIIYQLLGSSEVRFGELLDNIKGLSKSVLSSRLKSLQQSGIVDRKSLSCMPPQVNYFLTDKGRNLLPIFEQMREYGSKYSCK